jgi:geranylgeranylglycerol-phosphate geranylgeranyltransferase
MGIKMNPILAMRPMNGLLSAFGVWIGWSVERGDPFPRELSLFLLMFSSFMILAGGNLLNDMNDIDVDRRIHPRRPLASGTLTPASARRIFILLWISSIILTVFASYNNKTVYPMIIIVISIFLISIYESNLKETGFSGNLTIAILTGMPFLFGSSLHNAFGPLVLTLFLMAVLVNLSREILKDMEDIDGDIEFRRTLPIRVGLKKSKAIATISCFFAIMISLLVIYLTNWNLVYAVVVIMADILFLLSILRLEGKAGMSQRDLKRGMIIASVAFLSLSLI